MATKIKGAAEATPFSIRLDQQERKALAQASKRDDRPVAVIIRRLTHEWLIREGFLKS